MQGDNHADVVAQVKADLVARGVSLAGECGAFAICTRVAWQLRGEKAGLLVKTAGANCQGFASDIVMYPDGAIVDCLEDHGGQNGPQWNFGAPVDPTRYREAIDPGDLPVPAPGPTPTPTPAPPPAPPSIEDVFAELHALLDPIVLALTAETTALLRVSDQLATLQQHGVRVHF